MSTRSQQPLTDPTVDLAEFSDRLSQAWGVGTGFSAAQYIRWSQDSGVFAALAGRRPVAIQGLAEATTLSQDGIDSLVPILMALGLVRSGSHGYTLTALAEEYFLPDSPYYVGPGLFWGQEEMIPDAYLRAPLHSARPAFHPPEASRTLRIQLSRNLASGVCAVRAGRFERVRQLVDIGGGAGAIAIPFALNNPSSRVILVDLPSKLDAIKDIVRSYAVDSQFELYGVDVFAEPWSFPVGDGIVFSNFFHVFSDERCRFLAEKSASFLDRGGRVWLHELLFDEDKAGPLIAALWNANMRVIGGRQRTASELSALLVNSGFSELHETKTASRFTLIDAVRR